eukprot:NODE_8_length_66115_cov_0.981823.p27 type:complete len:262 gc:universal NODE_8_length_66115_cov_0.981823:43340-42555(-)
MASPAKPWESDHLGPTTSNLNTRDVTYNHSNYASGYSNPIGLNGGLNSFSNFGGGYNSFNNYGGYGLNTNFNAGSPVLAKLQTFQAIISTFYSTAHVLESSYQFIMNIVYIFIGMHSQIESAKSKLFEFGDNARNAILQLKNLNFKNAFKELYGNKPIINKEEFKKYIKNKDKNWNTFKLLLSIIGTIYFIRRIANYLLHIPIAKISKSTPEIQHLGLKEGDVVGILSQKLIDVENPIPQSLARWQGRSIKIPQDCYDLTG